MIDTILGILHHFREYEGKGTQIDLQENRMDMDEIKDEIFTSPFVFCKDRSIGDGRGRDDDCMRTYFLNVKKSKVVCISLFIFFSLHLQKHSSQSWPIEQSSSFLQRCLCLPIDTPCFLRLFLFKRETSLIYSQLKAISLWTNQYDQESIDNKIFPNTLADGLGNQSFQKKFSRQLLGCEMFLNIFNVIDRIGFVDTSSKNNTEIKFSQEIFYFRNR